MNEIRSSERGYTLLETVVAMSLFVGVLIPVIGLMGNLLLDNKAELKRNALLVAQSALMETASDEIGSRVYSSGENLQIRREVNRLGTLVQVKVVVLENKPPNREILSLSRSYIDSRRISP